MIQSYKTSHLLFASPTFGFFYDVADTESMAHMMKGLVPGVAPLIYVITGAGPYQVVQCIITRSFKECRSKSYVVRDYLPHVSRSKM